MIRANWDTAVYVSITVLLLVFTLLDVVAIWCNTICTFRVGLEFLT